MNFKKYTRGLALVTAICLLLTGAAFASIIGQLIDGYDVYLGSGMELSKGVYWTGSDYRTENYIEYSPDSDVYPLVVSGSKVCNYGSFSSMATLVENQGKHVIAGINGDYYVTSNYMPLGIVVEDGKLRSSDGGNWAVGFRADGTTIFGKPSLSVSIEINGQVFTMDSFNKTRTAGGAVILTDDFSTNTKNTESGRDIICTLDGNPTTSSNLTMTVTERVESTGDMKIPAGAAVISVSDKATQGLLDAIDSLAPNDTVKLKITCTSGWENVTYAIGSLYKLVTAGQVAPGLTADVNPRTAVGMKADGTLVFYTIDGRNSGHSIGVTMTQLAQRMIEMGCVEATIMDGGGSTSMNAIYIGNSSASQINVPSEGTPRSVSNYIMLVTDKKPTGTADRLALYPLSTNILSGAQTTFSLKAADANGYVANLNTPVSLAVGGNLGTISTDGVFTAAGQGRGSITATGSGLIPAEVNINVVQSPDTLRLFHEGKTTAITSLSVATESVTALMAQAMHEYVYLVSQDTCYTWSVDGNIGSIDEQGNFTAGTETAEGSITVSVGGKTLTIPVTVTSPDPFDDVKPEAWYYDAVEFVSTNGIMTGTGDRIFSPEVSASRAMVVVTLNRMSGTPAPAATAGFTDVLDGQWHANAIYWANENNIVNGFGTYFSPDIAITREQLATILYRYFGAPEVSGNLDRFADVGQVSSWAQDAMLWAVNLGIIDGLTPTQLSPGTSATRAQVATILMRLENM